MRQHRQVPRARMQTTWFRVALVVGMAGLTGLVIAGCAGVLSQSITPKDIVGNDIVASAHGEITIAAGDSVTVGYKIIASNNQPNDDFRGCNCDSDYSATLTLDSHAGVTASSEALTFTGCGAHQYIDFSSSSPGTHEITVHMTGGHGGSLWRTADASFSLVVTGSADTTPPTIGAPGANATIQCPAEPAFTAPTASDTQDPAPVVLVVSDVTTPDSCAGTYSRTITWKARDNAENESGTVSQTITVVDTTPPTLSGQGDNATFEYPAEPVLVFTPPTASDECDSAPVVHEVSDVTTPGSCAGLYSRTVAWKATDCAGNESGTVSQTITVVDTTPPTLSGQGDNATIECRAVPEFTAPTATDACDPTPAVVEVSDVTTPGRCAGAYSRTVAWKATDCAGNESGTVSQTITVVDTTPPTLSGQGDNATFEYPAEPVLVFTPPTASDECDSAPVVHEVSDVTTPGSCEGLYSRTVTWSATDCAGNTTSVSQIIEVVDTVHPGVTLDVPADGACYIIGAIVNRAFTGSDNYGPPTLVARNDGGIIALGSPISTTEGNHTFSVTATDCAGNETTVTHDYRAVRPTFSGLLSPWQARTTIKVGSTFPIKWGYFACGQLADSSLAAPALRIYQGINSSGTPVANTDAGKSGGPRYDTLAKQWIFNWQTTLRKAGQYAIYVDGTGIWPSAGPFLVTLGK